MTSVQNIQCQVWESSKSLKSKKKTLSNNLSQIFSQKLVDPLSWVKLDTEERKGFPLSSNLSVINSNYLQSSNNLNNIRNNVVCRSLKSEMIKERNPHLINNKYLENRKIYIQRQKDKEVVKVLEQRHQTQKQFIYMIIHDLRTPIDAIERSLNQAQIMMQTEFNAIT